MPLNQQKKRYVSVTIRLSIRKQQQQIKLNWTLQQVFDKLGLSETTNSRVESLKKLPFSPTEKKRPLQQNTMAVQDGYHRNTCTKIKNKSICHPILKKKTES